MASLIPGFEYDIFISYRQKDNKGDRWVSEFVEALKTELESTFKEEISVYFDINPHDGLLETHDVDASLKDKLKCLVFIPIISRTYCDPKSFAWEQEFKAFVKLASQDQYGLKVKLPNGNVASRVLPVQIHDLDNEDIKQCESVLGSVLRGIEFIYKEAGIDKPLAPEDNEKKNLNNTKYKIQIVKVAHAIKEIIAAIKQHEQKPEELSEKATEPPQEIRKGNKTRIIAGSIIALALIVLGILFIPKLFKPSEELEKSIAVLPFVNDSPDEENAFFINGIMEEVLNNLQKIKDFRILSRTSTEQYRGTSRPTIPEIAKKLGVNYIVEGSGQKYGNSFRLRVQLLEASKDKHIWAESYEKEIKEVKDFFVIQRQIAQAIAAELRVTITPEENQIIEKVPTNSITAYNYYLRGLGELWKYGTGSLDRPSIKRAEILFKQALEIDSTFARGYVGLGYVYWKKAFFEENYSKHFLDSMLTFANIALSYDDKLAEAYVIRAGYYAETGSNPNKPIEELDEAIKINPNLWEAYHEKGKYYWWSGNLVREIENRLKAISLNHGAELPELLRWIGDSFVSAGFPEKANYYYNEAFNLDGDSVKYFSSSYREQFITGNYNKSLELLGKIHAIDSNNYVLYRLFALNYLFTDQFEKSLKYLNRLKSEGMINAIPMHRIAYIYFINGYKKEADYYIDKSIEYNLETIETMGKATNMSPILSNSSYIHTNAHYNIACIYGVKGDKEKAIEHLKICKEKSGSLDWVMYIKNDPSFNSIRNEPEFQQIVRDIEGKYQAEHDRVRKWLEEQGML